MVGPRGATPQAQRKLERGTPRPESSSPPAGSSGRRGRLVHFEIHATDPQKLVTFYTKVFGWQVQPVPGMEYWFVSTGDKSEPGIDGGLMRRRGPAAPEGAPVNSFVCTIKVKTIEQGPRDVDAAGGRQVVPKLAGPAMDWSAYCKDPDGNIFGLWQDDPNAR